MKERKFTEMELLIAFLLSMEDDERLECMYSWVEQGQLLNWGDRKLLVIDVTEVSYG